MKPILFILLFALPLTAAHGQVLGIKLGATVSNTFDSESASFSDNAKVGYSGGVFARLLFTNSIGLQPEVLFTQRGFIGTGTFLGADYRLDRTLNYIDVPVMVAVLVTPSITLLAGPQYSYLFKQTDEYSSGSTTFTDETEFSDRTLDESNISFTGGVDMDLDPLVIGLRTGWDTKSWYQLSIGFRF
jgi:hypothetical protein